MVEAFLIALRESLQYALPAGLILFYPPIRDSRSYRNSFIAGLAVALTAGFAAGCLPYPEPRLFSNEAWTLCRNSTGVLLFYLSIFFLFVRISYPASVVSAGLFFLGFLLFVFEARSIGFLIHDISAIRGKTLSLSISGFTGAAAGLLPLFLLRRLIRKIPLDKAFSLPTLFLTLGTLQFWFSGINELDRENVLIALQRGLLTFLGESARFLQDILLIQTHPFITVPLSGLAALLSGDNMVMTLTLLFILTPPLIILRHLFQRPDPILSGLATGSQRRYQTALFRKELALQTAPVLIGFIVLLGLLHSANITLNPMYEPLPVAVREAGDETVIRIPVSGSSADLTDRKLRKYVYFYGNKQIIFIAILKPDGTVGVALDECEICRPAEWNIDAKGYAQRGENLICKYCMTPIATSTINNPGGCNPIPLPFLLDNTTILITLEDLIAVFKKAQEMERRGSHL